MADEMVSMTCEQLGGAKECNVVFSGTTFQELKSQSQAHGKVMFAAQDAPHIEAMNAMMAIMRTPDAMQKWMSEKEADFDIIKSGGAAATSSSINAKITIIPAKDVSTKYKEEASHWPLWDSETHPQTPPLSGKFPFVYNGNYATERVLIVTGEAIITPDDGSAIVTIHAGDAIYFHHGFSCQWQILEAMTKHYAYFNEACEETRPPQIACDNCGVECFEKSYLVNDTEDICPDCYKLIFKGNSNGGMRTKKNTTVVMQEYGEDVGVIVPTAAKKRKTKE